MKKVIVKTGEITRGYPGHGGFVGNKITREQALSFEKARNMLADGEALIAFIDDYFVNELAQAKRKIWLYFPVASEDFYRKIETREDIIELLQKTEEFERR
jgi:hypothetical protein